MGEINNDYGTGLNLLQKIIFILLGAISRFMQLFGIYVVAVLLSLNYGHMWIWTTIVVTYTVLDFYRGRVLNKNGYKVDTNTMMFVKKEPKT